MATNLLKPGQIITFYSYKGGTGRSMALANYACWLVKKYTARERRVLVMDWDLEAPGLHRYFAETAERTENLERPGIINYFDAIQTRLRDDPQLYDRLEDDEGWRVLGEEFPLDQYLIRDVVAGADLVKAGRYDAGYAELISTFNWVEFYHDFGAVFPAFRDFLLQTYDFCLIDSRTGFNDVSGICTMLLPERLVTVFTPNRQNVSGVIDLAARAADYRLSSSDPRTLSIFPLPSRIENAEHELRKEWQRQYQKDFETKFQSIYKLDACDLTEYFDDVQLPHVSFYSYGEEVALLREERSGSLSLRRAYELFFEKLAGLKFAWDKQEASAIVALPAELTSTIVVTRDTQIYVSDRRKDYDSDIYISYAHIDNEPLLPGQEGWVETFQKVLETRLSQLLGEPVKIWRDQKLQGNDVFSDTLFRILPKTNILVAIITPPYVKSEWCMRELAEFYRQAEQSDGSSLDGKSRIIKVVKSPVAYEEVGQSLLQSVSGYEFYEISENGRPREFVPGTSGSDRRFWERLDDLAYDIADLLKKQRRASEGWPTTDAPLRRSGVYLAETTTDLDFQRDSIRRELQQRGYEVLPDGRLPREAGAFREAVRAYLERCRLSVHLVGNSYGLIPEGEDRSVVEIQNELAAERSMDVSFSRVIWMPIGLHPRDLSQREFIERLQMDAGAQQGADLLRAPLEQLKTVLIDKLARVAGQAPPPTDDGPIRIYLICERRDIDNVEPLVDYLFDLGYEVILPVFEGDGAEILQNHKENLLLCDAVLIYHGHGNLLWLQSKLTDLRKVMGWGRAEPMRAQAVLLAAPETEEKKRFRTREAMVIKDFGNFSAETLRSFVETIQQAKEIKLNRNS
jgi:cellulose biosynthesis protein BcsQ